MKDKKRIVQEALVKQGVSTSRIGFNYLTEATLYQCSKGDERFFITKDLYPYLADKFKAVSAGSVERAIRSAIISSFDHYHVDHEMAYGFSNGGNTLQTKSSLPLCFTDWRIN